MEEERREGAGTPPPGGEGRRWTEQIEVAADQLVARVQDLVAAGNVRRLIIRHEGRTVLDIPLTGAVVGGVVGIWLAPFLSALVLIGGLVARVQVIIEREGESPSGGNTTDVTTTTDTGYGGGDTTYSTGQDDPMRQ